MTITLVFVFVFLHQLIHFDIILLHLAADMAAASLLIEKYENKANKAISIRCVLYMEKYAPEYHRIAQN